MERIRHQVQSSPTIKSQGMGRGQEYQGMGKEQEYQGMGRDRNTRGWGGDRNRSKGDFMGAGSGSVDPPGR